MKRLSVYVVALVVAVLLSYAVGTYASKGRNADSRDALDMSNPYERITIDCDGRNLSSFKYWPGVGVRTYTARFTAMHAGKVRLLVGGTTTVVLIPEGEIEHNYTAVITTDWDADLPIEVSVDAQPVQQGCQQSPLLMWDYQLDVTP